VRITVLGKSPSWPDADGACSGYLVQVGDFSLLLDCGTGVFAKLRGVIDYLTLDAALITHLHSDHFFDLVPFSYALLLSPRRQGDVAPALHVPPKGRSVLAGMVGAWSTGDLVERAFDLQEYDPWEKLSVGPLQVRFCEVPHYTTAYAVELTDGEQRLTFSADCGPNPELIEFARDTDLLLIEATLPGPDTAAGPRGHLTAREAGEHGRQAGAQRLVITHFSDEFNSRHLQQEASAGFAGPVDLAHGGAVYDLRSRGAG
jgi:ribonuclease BN (tRNA processing enzyme)